jgi:hypothetical protein
MPKIILRTARSILPALYLVVSPTLAQPTFIIPSIPKHSLDKDFPEQQCRDPKELSTLRKCRSELEIFRKNSLERYNQQIQEHRQSLNEISADLELKRREGYVGPKAHTKINKKIQQELYVTSGKGVVMKPYLEYQERYQRTNAWVVGEITQIERSQKVFRSKH